MTISAYTVPELEFYRRMCNFTRDEALLFELRAENKTLEECCALLNMEIGGVKGLSKKVNAKIDFIKKTMDPRRWIAENF